MVISSISTQDLLDTSIDILLRLKAGGITAPHRFAWLGVSGLGLSLGLQTPNTNTKPVHRWNRCVTGHWAISRECHISAPSTPLLTRGEFPVLVVPQEFRSLSLSPDSELLVLVTRARWLFDSHMGHPVSSVGGHSHSNRHFSGTRLHRGQSQCAVVQQNRLKTTV